jgi:xanthine dehydrogenase small subunit
MVTFILNNEKVTTGKAAGSSLLDFIRYDMGLTGTRTGCREGDCGACTVLEGTLVNGIVLYKSVVSCLMPLGNAHGKHIVTVEGINTGQLSPLQSAMINNSAIQCGFCTPGFVMSLMSESLTHKRSTRDSLMASLSGNICRCTGYKSIERAVDESLSFLFGKDISDPVRWLVGQKALPEYFLKIAERLAGIADHETSLTENNFTIAGGTDLMVQRAEELAETGIFTLHDLKELKGIKAENGRCTIGAAVTISEAAASEVLKKYIPDLPSYARLIASEQIRNMATLGGNIVNASPIGDMSVILLALNAELNIMGGNKMRSVPLRDFFLGYKKTDLEKNEYIRDIIFDYSMDPALFSFEKVSKRTHLDIASVNSAVRLMMNGPVITECHLSAGGVSPVPLYLRKTGSFLSGKQVSDETVFAANEIMQEEISPISDVRGDAEYKRLLLRQLLFAHFLKLFPERVDIRIEQL